jgi:DNA-directed RNA polymerase subunit omega
LARITVEDCTEKVPNRFHLVQMASIRTKQLKKGARALVASEDNKEVVVALREIAAGFIKPDYPGRRRAEAERARVRFRRRAGSERDRRAGRCRLSDSSPPAA